MLALTPHLNGAWVFADGQPAISVDSTADANGNFGVRMQPIDLPTASAAQALAVAIAGVINTFQIPTDTAAPAPSPTAVPSS
jgi:hypothetical protein